MAAPAGLVLLASARAWVPRPASPSQKKPRHPQQQHPQQQQKRLLRLQLSAAPGPERFRLGLKGAPDSGTETSLVEYSLKEISYEVKTPTCHELKVLARPDDPLVFHFEDEQEAQKWWSVVSTFLREAQKASEGPSLLPGRLLPHPSAAMNSLPTSEPEASLLSQLARKEELALRLSAAIDLGDEVEAVRSATALSQQQAPLRIVLKESCYPTSEISMKVQVEDAMYSASISTRVHTHTTIAALRQQVFQDYGFHPSVQRWVIGQCLCVDDRTLSSYGIRRDGDTAFLYLLSAKGANLSEQRFKEDKDWVVLQPAPSPPADPSDARRKYSTLPNPQPKKAGSKDGNRKMDIGEISQFLGSLQLGSLLPGHSRAPPAAAPAPPPPPPPVQAGWPCPTCTFINKPTRPGCEMCSTDRPANYVVPGSYQPDETELWRIQQEKEGILQYQKAQEQERLLNFQQLRRLDAEALVPNREAMECRICYMEADPGEGVLLRECLHSFCKDCLRQLINCTEEPQVSCPFRDDSYACGSHLQDREIRALVSWEEYERFLERRLAVAESRAQNSYHCQTVDCLGWCIYEDDVNEFRCPICWALNCLVCKAIHEGMNCKQYQDKLQFEAQNDAAARETSNMLKMLVQLGEAMHCPVCRIVVQKKGGCDWIRCPVCQTEICWVTKGPRWGPGGPGDISGGCRCNVDGERCHPNCQNCH
uniref:RanBP-type and C3HC4-type zinc finger-containing protein 1 n=1 Tax=Anolis carolinensis TaxID=28377 RepID=H9GCI4_ANOCA|nr:PREDICTED: sharpin isoform X1 [Anolis carolinensis]|eukprot:XP_016853835.1 PREDICTED: sharpin isoform X1 [Anolis carolinensis]